MEKQPQQGDTSTRPEQKPTDAGMNRTGIGASPIDKRKLEEAAAATEPPMPNGHAIEMARVAIAREVGPVGSLPPPTTLKGMIKTLMERAEGHKPTVFLDKLGERLAFERTGTRLYDALIAKFENANIHQGGPSRAELERIREDEHRHMLLVRDAMEQLGADPTAMTPCADVIAVAGLGWVQALSDPRTTFTQGLDVILVAELADVDGWGLLTTMAEGLGFDDLAHRFHAANVQEEEHLQRVRTWISIALLGQAGVDVAAPPPESSLPHP
jgi:rubrerythrin